MGFRNPITSATDVDTRATATTAGVLIEQDHSAIYPRGTIRFVDALAGDLDARIYRHAEGNPRADPPTGLTGGLTLDGGTYHGVAAPVLDLAVLPVGDGSVIQVARLTGVPLIDNGEPWRDLPIGPAWAAWDTAANRPQYRRDVAGVTEYSGMVKLVTGQSIAAGATLPVCNMPAGFYLSGARAYRSSVVLNASGFFVALIPAWVDANGAVTLYNVTASAFTAGFGFSLGFSAPNS